MSKKVTRVAMAIARAEGHALGEADDFDAYHAEEFIEHAKAAIDAAGDAEAAEKWRTLIKAKCLRLQGYAGFGHGKGGTGNDPDPSGYRHFGMDFWTYHSAPPEYLARSNAEAIDILERFIEQLRKMT